MNHFCQENVREYSAVLLQLLRVLRHDALTVLVGAWSRLVLLRRAMMPVITSPGREVYRCYSAPSDAVKEDEISPGDNKVRNLTNSEID